MGRKEVEYIKTNKKLEIERCVNNNYGIIFGHEKHLSYDVCFARLSNRLDETPKGNSMQYLLKWFDNDDLIDQSAIMDELKKIFGHRFSIFRYKSGRKNCRIIDIRERKPLPHRDLRYVGYYLIMNLLRTIDAEGRKNWVQHNHKLEFRNTYKDKFPLNNWYDLLYIWNKEIGGYGHSINDNLWNIRPTRQNNNLGAEVLFQKAIQDYINILTTAFGKKFNMRIRKEEFIKIMEEVKTSTKSYYRDDFKYNQLSCGQTPCYNIAEKIVKERNDKNVQKRAN